MTARPDRPAVWAGAALLLAGLACGPALTGPDTVATVNAVSTQVQATLAAGLTPSSALPSLTPGPASTTALPQNRPVTATASPTRFTTATITPNLPAAATATALARPNGPVLVAARRDQAPTLDGSLDDWLELPYSAAYAAFRPENWGGPADLSARFALGWDAAHLFVAAAVTDDVFVQTQRGETLFRGDSLELLVDVELRSDFDSTQLSGDDYQLGLSPGTSAGEAPESFLWFPREQDRAPVGEHVIVVAAQRTEAGYRLEAAIPWPAFGYLAPPQAGWRLGFVLSLSDNDTPDTAEQQCLVASVPGRRLTDPTTWGTLELGN